MSSSSDEGCLFGRQSHAQVLAPSMAAVVRLSDPGSQIEDMYIDKSNTLHILSITMSRIITIKTDEDTKRQAQAVAKDMGLTMSSLINSYLKQVIATRRVVLYAPEQMTPKLEKLIEQVEKDRDNGEVSQAFNNVDDFLDDLHS